MKTTVTEVDPADLDVASETETSDTAEGREERTFGPKIKLVVEVDEETRHAARVGQAGLPVVVLHDGV